MRMLLQSKFATCVILPGVLLALSLSVAGAEEREQVVRSYVIDVSCPATVDLSYPVFGNDAVDAAIADTVDQIIAEFEDSVWEDDELRENGEFRQSVSCYELLGYPTVHSDGDIISLELYFEEFLGGLRPERYHMPFNFVASSGIEIGLADFFSGDDSWLQIVSDALRRVILEDFRQTSEEPWLASEDLPWETLSGTAPGPEKFSLFFVDEAGITIQFRRYQIGPGALGSPAFFIPGSMLGDSFDPGLGSPSRAISCDSETESIKVAICDNLDLALLEKKIYQWHARLASPIWNNDSETLDRVQNKYLDRVAALCESSTGGMAECLETEFHQKLEPGS